MYAEATAIEVGGSEGEMEGMGVGGGKRSAKLLLEFQMATEKPGAINVPSYALQERFN